MIRLLSISGSPVEGSSTDLVLDRLAGSVVESLAGRAKVESTFVKLNEHSPVPCQACGEAPVPELCFYDDLNDIYRELEECDCLLFGSPIFFDSVSAQAKLFIDRCNCFRPADFSNADPGYTFIRRVKRKRPGAIVLVGGENGWFEGARRVVAGFFKWVEVANQGLITYSSPDHRSKGTAVGDRALMAETERLGRHLASLLAERNDSQCE